LRHGAVFPGDVKAFLFKILARLFSFVHPRSAPALARPVAALTWRLSRRLRTVSLKNLELCYPDRPEAERRALARAAMAHYVRSGFEVGITWCWPRERFEGLFEAPEGWSHFEEGLRAGRGLLLLAPHYGAWEMLGMYLSEHLGATLYKPSGDPSLDALLVSRRERFGARLVPADRRGLRALMDSLRAGKAAGVLPDQEPRAGEGRFAPFFGVPALTGVLVPRLLQRTGAAAVFAVCRRLPGGRFRVHVIPAPADIASPDVDRAVAAVNRGVERCIALAPEQYLWAYKRFRARPEGEGRFY
jgi:KDO2-lipid IV(A) lauroyltransferase